MLPPPNRLTGYNENKNSYLNNTFKYIVLNCFQVYVTGADGEQMVLSGPEAAALLAQAGISLGEQEQV